MPILTSKDLPVGPQSAEVGTQVPAGPTSPTGVVYPREEEDMRDKYVLDRAPKGECRTGIYLLGPKRIEYPVVLVDGVILVDDPDPVQKKLIGDSLIASGFRHAGQVPDKPAKEEDQGTGVPDVLPEPIKLMHPDNTASNLIDVTVTVAKKKVDVVGGYIESQDPAVVRGLIKRGYIVQNPHALERAREGKEGTE